MIGTTELLIIGLIAFLFFGSTRLPRLFRTLGKARSEFEKGKKEGESEDQD